MKPQMRKLVAKTIRSKRPVKKPSKATPSRIAQAFSGSMQPQTGLPPAKAMGRNDIIARALDMLQRQQTMNTLKQF